jgi:hypothetical protein
VVRLNEFRKFNLEGVCSTVVGANVSLVEDFQPPLDTTDPSNKSKNNRAVTYRWDPSFSDWARFMQQRMDTLPTPATASLANTNAASSASGAVDRRGDVVVVNVGHGTTGTRFLFNDVFCDMGLAGIHYNKKCNWNGTTFPDWPQEGTFTDAASWLAEMREWISRTAHSGNLQYLTDFVGFFPDLVLGELRAVGVQPVLLLSVRDPAAWAEGRTHHIAAPVCRTGAVADALDLSACVERAPNHGRGVDFWSLVQRASTTNQSRLREAIAAYQAKWKPKVNLYVDLFVGERREGPSIKRGLEKCGLVKSAESKLTFTPQVEAGKPCDI